MPAWTERNDRDPGVTLLGLLAWLAVGFAFGAAYSRRRRAWPSRG